MIHPANFEDKINFLQVRELLTGRCLSDMGKRLAISMGFQTDVEVIRRLLRETREFLTILEKGLPFPSNDYLDLTPALERIKKPGTWIFPEELSELRLSLRTIADCLSFFRLSAAREFINLKALAGELELPGHLIQEIDQIIDEKNEIRDQASANLFNIRKEIQQKTLASSRIINQLFNLARNSGWISADIGVTLSDGRLVIPILATHKRKIKGIIHDESASGQTVYLEPEACMEINNDIRELDNAERREIIRILTRFSDSVRPEIETLLKAYAFLGMMDFIRAKARLAYDFEANEPLLAEEPYINWSNARHPLLELSLRAKNKTIVPLNVRLEPNERILVITGPNAGGKSVCLKATGLIQYMLQCGLLVPMNPDSKACVFENIFIDIGDEQSLENDLSTYSSHLLNLKLFIELGSPDTLFLIDELGTGTDPALGGAIAEAALEKLSGTYSFGIVTTHYSNLKLLEGRIPGIINGAMLFDTDHLQPLYQLAIGKPGSSFTFEIARRIGFTEDVIQSAIAKAGTTHLDFEQQLNKLEKEKLKLEKRLQEFQVADGFLSELIEKYESLKADLEKNRSMILENARRDAQEMLEQSNRMIEKTIREIRESQAEKGITRSARGEIEKFKKEFEPPPAPEQKLKAAPVNAGSGSEWKAGDWVSFEDQKMPGRIHRVKGGKVIVDFEGVRITLPVYKIKPAKEPGHHSVGHRSSLIKDLNEKAVQFKLTLDIRGNSADEALMKVQKYIDDAYLLRIKEISILHGKGGGILRRVIREFLSDQDEVVSFEDEHIERGGAGITKVVIR